MYASWHPLDQGPRPALPRDAFGRADAAGATYRDLGWEVWWESLEENPSKSGTWLMSWDGNIRICWFTFRSKFKMEQMVSWMGFPWGFLGKSSKPRELNDRMGIFHGHILPNTVSTTNIGTESYQSYPDGQLRLKQNHIQPWFRSCNPDPSCLLVEAGWRVFTYFSGSSQVTIFFRGIETTNKYCR